mgnify:CR=1 FL=1
MWYIGIGEPRASASLTVGTAFEAHATYLLSRRSMLAIGGRVCKNCGSGEANWLELTRNSFNCRRLASDCGIVDDSAFENRFSVCSAVKLPRFAGIGPEKSASPLPSWWRN